MFCFLWDIWFPRKVEVVYFQGVYIYIYLLLDCFWLQDRFPSEMAQTVMLLQPLSTQTFKIRVPTSSLVISFVCCAAEECWLSDKALQSAALGLCLLSVPGPQLCRCRGGRGGSVPEPRSHSCGARPPEFPRAAQRCASVGMGGGLLQSFKQHFQIPGVIRRWKCAVLWFEQAAGERWT